jgi:hypothetical protein
VILTTAQKQTVKAAILADGTASTKASGPGTDYAWITDWLNTLSTFIVWRTSVNLDEIQSDAAFDWTRVDNLSVGKGRIWEWMFTNSQRTINPSQANVRAGVSACWVGTAQDLAVQAAVFVHCKRAATLAEKILSTGTGTTGTPGFLTAEGTVGIFEIGDILAS